MNNTATKKILSLALSFALALGMFTFSPVTARAAGEDMVITGTSGGWTYASHILTITGDGTYTISMAAPGATSTTDRILVSSGVTAGITLDGVKIDRSGDYSETDMAIAFDMTGATVDLTLSGDSLLKSGLYRTGLQVPSGATLTIGGSGSLTVVGGLSCTAIGGNWGGAPPYVGGTCGDITINSGTITAIAGMGGAGIGGGFGTTGGEGGNITINGGTVTATGKHTGAGIGAGGTNASGGNITISGGTVIATGGESIAAGIGGGNNSAGGNILIYGENTNVTAKALDHRAQDIGGGGGAAGNIFVALPEGNLKNASGNIGNTVNFTANPVTTTGNVQAALPSPFNTVGSNSDGVISLMTGLGTGTNAKTMSVLTTMTTQQTTFSLSGYDNSPIVKTGAELMTSGASVDFVDTTAPTITSITPENNASGVSLSGTIAVTFSEAIGTTGTVSLNGVPLSTTDAVLSGNTYTIPYSGLAYAAAYTVTVAGFQDLAGNTMTEDSSNSFTTVIPSDPYIALGDSVPAGYGLASPTSMGYPALFSGLLTDRGFANTLSNQAVSGTTSGALLATLSSLPATSVQALALGQANVITLNIGGNNVLGPMIDLMNQTAYTLFGVSDFSQVPPELLPVLIAAVSEAMANLPQPNQFTQGIAEFAADFPQIITWLRANAPNAKIVVSTIYNPFPASLAAIPLSADLYNAAEQMMGAMNLVILQGQMNGSTPNYAIADTYSAFKAATVAVTNFNLLATPPSVDIHPNAVGHQLMALLHLAAFFAQMPVVSSGTLPDGTVGVAYTSAVTVSNPQASNQPMLFTITSGSLPSGLSLNPAAGAISGVPSQPGTFNFSVAVRNADGVLPATPHSITIADQTFALTVRTNGGGTVSGTAGGNYVAGTAVSLTAAAYGNYYFSGWTVSGVTVSNTSANPLTFSMPAGAVTVTANFTYNGDGGDRSDPYTPPVTLYPVEITAKPGFPTTARLTLSVSPDRNNALTHTITREMVRQALDKAKERAKADGREELGYALEFIFSTTKTIDSLNISFAPDAPALLESEGVKESGVITNAFRWIFDPDAMKEINLQREGQSITVKAERFSKLSDAAKRLIGTRPVWDVTIGFTKGGTAYNISMLGKGVMTMGVKYTPASTEKTGNLAVIYVPSDGKPQILTNSGYDNGWLNWQLSSLSVYGVGYITPAPVFTDTIDHWGKDNIDFVVFRGLLSGTTNTTFSPDTAVTRAMFITALGRLSGADVNGYKTGNFTDVPAGSYYLPYVEWAVANEIVSGTGEGMFSPDSPITREDMAVMMQNYAKATGYKIPVAREKLTFADDSDISSYAKDAVTAIQQAGIIVGRGNNRFAPKSNATRAEAATILRWFVELVIDKGTA